MGALLPLILGATSSAAGAAFSNSGGDASVKGGFSGLPWWASAGLSALTSQESRREQERAAADNLKRYYEALGNASGLYNRSGKQLSKLNQQTYNNLLKFGQMSADRWGSMSGPTDFSRFRTQLPESQPYQHGGGMGPAEFNPSPRDLDLLSVAGVDGGPAPRDSRNILQEFIHRLGLGRT